MHMRASDLARFLKKQAQTPSPSQAQAAALLPLADEADPYVPVEFDQATQDALMGVRQYPEYQERQLDPNRVEFVKYLVREGKLSEN